MLNFSFGTILFQIVAFLILMAIVAKFGMRPMLDVMKKRQDYIDNEITAAEKARERAEEAIEKQKKALEEARNEAYQIVENAKKQAESQGEKILANAKQQAERTLEEAKAEIEREREKALASLRAQTAELSVMLASKIIEKELDEKQQAKEIDQFLSEMGERL
ncbi:MAG TPA: F0F1 ATP synthase subunit B [Bacillales bacterium]|nr:F0F1 ATP synthase subunit B [Bacillales bacterium]